MFAALSGNWGLFKKKNETIHSWPISEQIDLGLRTTGEWSQKVLILMDRQTVGFGLLTPAFPRNLIASRFKEDVASSHWLCVACECVCERGNVACVVKRFFLGSCLLLNLPHLFSLQILSFLVQNNTQNVINVQFLMIHGKKCLQKNSKGQAVMCSVFFFLVLLAEQLRDISSNNKLPFLRCQ